uniref:Uncharacterized protein n=1 Tax=Davidia involucrata TaxID=16924 RepID=A0A5B7BVK5_DAVIN
MPRMEDILNLPVQDPPCAEFSAAHLNWVKVEGGRQGGDDIALIPFSRVDDFVKGESTNAECPASFRIESRRKRPEGSISKPRVDGYLEYTLYVLACTGVLMVPKITGIVNLVLGTAQTLNLHQGREAGQVDVT